jgi:vanillin dehydrogenase
MLDTRPAKTLRGMYIGGQWVRAARNSPTSTPMTAASGPRRRTAPPADAAPPSRPRTARLSRLGGAEVHRTRQLMNRIADVWERRAPDFIAAVQAEGGGWFGKGAFEAHYVADVFRAAAATCYDATGEVLPRNTASSRRRCASRWA